MALPVTPNTTCDIYRAGNNPPAAPDVAGVRCNLKPDWRGGMEAGDRAGLTAASVWTHIMEVETSVDIRDNYAGALATNLSDHVWVPDKNGTKFIVVFIERVGRGTAFDYKRAYLDRQAPTWPSDNL